MLEHFSTGTMTELGKPLGARPRHWGLDLWAQEQTQHRTWPEDPTGPTQPAQTFLRAPGGQACPKGTDTAHRRRAFSQSPQQQSPNTVSLCAKGTKSYRTASRTLP